MATGVAGLVCLRLHAAAEDANRGISRTKTWKCRRRPIGAATLHDLDGHLWKQSRTNPAGHEREQRRSRCAKLRLPSDRQTWCPIAKTIGMDRSHAP